MSCSSTRAQYSVPGAIASTRATVSKSPSTTRSYRPVTLLRQRQWSRPVSSDGTASGALGCYICYVPTILLVGVDVFFRGKLEGLLPGHHLTTTDSVDPPELVICDVSRIDPEDVADNYPEVPILGFTNHTDTDGLRRAHTAGFDQVIAKSAMDEQLKGLVDGLLASGD